METIVSVSIVSKYEHYCCVTADIWTSILQIRFLFSTNHINFIQVFNFDWLPWQQKALFSRAVAVHSGEHGHSGQCASDLLFAGDECAF